MYGEMKKKLCVVHDSVARVHQNYEVGLIRCICSESCHMGLARMWLVTYVPNDPHVASCANECWGYAVVMLQIGRVPVM